ncbi:MAG: hypothetical protein ACE37F_05310 [Nannocystaceae bacterium]|nr:hypothetical protein [bacterium]
MTTPSEREPIESAEALLRRPRWTRVRKVALIRREVREYLPASTVEVLLSEGETVVEGGAEVVRDGASSRVFATLMITADLAALSGRFRDRPDAATASRVADLLDGHPDLEPKLIARARARLPELAGPKGAAQWTITVEPQVRAQGSSIMIDADVVAVPTDGKVG